MVHVLYFIIKLVKMVVRVVKAADALSQEAFIQLVLIVQFDILRHSMGIFFHLVSPDVNQIIIAQQLVQIF